ncbi:MAG: hypothetical protein ACLT69_13655 [Intestinibacter bartlettii]
MNLLQDLKLKLNITWVEEETENRLQTILKDAVSTLDYKLGADVDYSEGMEEIYYLIIACMHGITVKMNLTIIILTTLCS